MREWSLRLPIVSSVFKLNGLIILTGVVIMMIGRKEMQIRAVRTKPTNHSQLVSSLRFPLAYPLRLVSHSLLSFPVPWEPSFSSNTKNKTINVRS